MNNNDLIEFTPEGFEKAAALFDFLPEEERIPILIATLNEFLC